MKNKTAFSLVCIVLASAAWSSEMEEPTELKQIKCSIIPVDRAIIHPQQTANSGNMNSSNWSGYVAGPTLQKTDVGSVTYVAGSWKVPTIIASTNATYCAIWVGIDGFSDETVEQIGTSHNWQDGAQQNYAWFEMYPNGAYIINNFPVDVGDVIGAKVGYKENGVFKMIISNLTKGVTTTVPMTSTTTANAGRSSAEWIVEAPYSGSILPLSDFGITTFNYCSTIINGVQGSINDSLWANDTITMGGGGQIFAQPSALLKNGECFQVTWKNQ